MPKHAHRGVYHQMFDESGMVLEYGWIGLANNSPSVQTKGGSGCPNGRVRIYAAGTPVNRRPCRNRHPSSLHKPEGEKLSRGNKEGIDGFHLGPWEECIASKARKKPAIFCLPIARKSVLESLEASIQQLIALRHPTSLRPQGREGENYRGALGQCSERSGLGLCPAIWRRIVITLASVAEEFRRGQNENTTKRRHHEKVPVSSYHAVRISQQRGLKQLVIVRVSTPQCGPGNPHPFRDGCDPSEIQVPPFSTQITVKFRAQESCAQFVECLPGEQERCVRGCDVFDDRARCPLVIQSSADQDIGINDKPLNCHRQEALRAWRLSSRLHPLRLQAYPLTPPHASIRGYAVPHIVVPFLPK